MINVVEMAYQIIDLHEENKQLRARVDRLEQYEQKYNDLVVDNLNHGQQMMGNWITALLNPNSPISLGLKAKAEKEEEDGSQLPG